MTTKSLPRRPYERFYGPEDLDRITGLIEDEGIGIERRDGLLMALATVHHELLNADDTRDVESLEKQVVALLAALDLKVQACGGAAGGAADPCVERRSRGRRGPTCPHDAQRPARPGRGRS